MKLKEILKFANRHEYLQVSIGQKCIYNGKLCWGYVLKKYLDCEVVYMRQYDDYFGEPLLEIEIEENDDLNNYGLPNNNEAKLKVDKAGIKYATFENNKEEE